MAKAGANLRAPGDLVAWAHDRGIVPEDLDELVHELKAAEAAEINNGGLEAQLGYLLECYGTADAVKETLIEEFGG